MTKIIGHRGAAGLALENSRESIQAALKLQLDALEFDVRRTSDYRAVVIHDRHTGRIANKKLMVNRTTLADLRELRLKNGQTIPTLEEMIELIGSAVPILIDLKDDGLTGEIIRLADAHPEADIRLTGRHHHEMAQIHEARPNIPFLTQHHFDPLEIIHTASSLGASGISLNMWLMNPLTYRLAKQNELDVYLYTVNHPWLIRFFRRLYPDVAIFTNHPQRFRRPKSGTAKGSPKTKRK
jgi:glycerophosphoryl diester phosphodiesterase